MLEQLKEHLARKPFEPFGIELSTGRTLAVYDALEVAILNTDAGGLVAVGQDDHFEIVQATHIASLRLTSGFKDIQERIFGKSTRRT